MSIQYAGREKDEGEEAPPEIPPKGGPVDVNTLFDEKNVKSRDKDKSGGDPFQMFD